ncbi:MAG: dGTPase [Sulfurovum sp.]|jgi:dGTPase
MRGGEYTDECTGKNSQGTVFDDIDECTESNRGRIINSPAVRRLQQKTQVFPLEINAAVRSRLTHSLEVQQNARYLARTIIKDLKEKKKLKKYGLEGLEHAFVSTAEMASLMHDIGNPPFGHFGELAINDWMTAKGIKCLNTSLNIQDDSLLPKDMQILKDKLERDICNFEGNAQAIRMVHTLQGLNLTYSQIASILKYGRAAYEEKPSKNDAQSYLKKKPGYYFSEEEFVKELHSELNMEDGCRFPLTYIMEAADDISYGIADLEDGVDKGLISLKKLYETIKNEADKYGENGEYVKCRAQKAYDYAKEKQYLKVNSFVVMFRTNLVNDLVKYAAKKFIKNHKAIYEGTYNQALLENNNSKYDVALEVLKNVAFKHVFEHPEVETLELKGHSALKGIFDTYMPILEASHKEFEKLVNEGRADSPIVKRLYKRLPNKHVAAYVKIIDSLKEKKELEELEYKLYEWYYRARLLIDFISGMTDEFALKEYQTLSALN